MTPAYVVFDTETTGLFKFRDKAGKPVPADAEGQPRMASFAAVLADHNGQEIGRVSRYVRPDGWSIDGTKAAEVNGLTDAFLRDNGVPVAEVLDLWQGWIEAGAVTAAYNAQFDQKMMRAELRRAGRDDLFEKTRNVCLMRALEPYADFGLCVRKGRVKLSEACKFFSVHNAAAHDAMADAEAAFAIMQRLMADGNLPDARVHYARAA